MRLVMYPRLTVFRLIVARVVLILSGLVNTLLGLHLAFGISQPLEHLALSQHARLPYIRYIFQGHGFLVAQLGLMQLFAAAILAHPVALTLAAGGVLVGDVFFAVSMYRLLGSDYVPHEAEMEVAWGAVWWALGEGLAMAGVMFICWPQTVSGREEEDDHPKRH